jgi:hypothetical protein
MPGCAVSGGCSITCDQIGLNCGMYFANACPVDGGLCVVQGDACKPASPVDCASIKDEDTCNSHPECKAQKNCG